MARDKKANYQVTPAETVPSDLESVSLDIEETLPEAHIHLVVFGVLGWQHPEVHHALVEYDESMAGFELEDILAERINRLVTDAAKADLEQYDNGSYGPEGYHITWSVSPAQRDYSINVVTHAEGIHYPIYSGIVGMLYIVGP